MRDGFIIQVNKNDEFCVCFSAMANSNAVTNLKDIKNRIKIANQSFREKKNQMNKSNEQIKIEMQKMACNL